jgi:parvulin-like peptidyl-prolyl isomerase
MAPPNEYGETIDTVVASVDGNPITSHDVKDPAAAQAAGLAGVPAGARSAGSAPDSSLVLKSLIEQKLLEQESEKFADKVGDDEVDRYLQNMEERNHVTDEQLHTQLQSQGISYAQFRQSIRKQVQAAAMLDREVRQKIVIPDSEIEAYYKANPSEFSVTEEKYRLAQILIAVPSAATPEQSATAQKKAEDVRSQAVKGKDFAELARQYSDDDSKSKGGELGDFGPNDLNDQIAAAVKNLKAGEISAVVHTRYGFHIVKVEEHQIPGAIPLSQAKVVIRDKLTTERAKVGFQKWIDEDLTSQHYVETMN